MERKTLNQNEWDKYKKREENDKINLALLDNFENDEIPLKYIRIPSTDELRFIHKILTNYTTRQDKITLIEDLIFHLRLIKESIEK